MSVRRMYFLAAQFIKSHSHLKDIQWLSARSRVRMSKVQLTHLRALGPLEPGTAVSSFVPPMVSSFSQYFTSFVVIIRTSHL